MCSVKSYTSQKSQLTSTHLSRTILYKETFKGTVSRVEFFWSSWKSQQYFLNERLWFSQFFYCLLSIFRYLFFIWKQCFFSQIYFGSNLWKMLEVFLNSESVWRWSPVYKLNTAWAIKAFFRWCLRRYRHFAKLRVRVHIVGLSCILSLTISALLTLNATF